MAEAGEAGEAPLHVNTVHMAEVDRETEDVEENVVEEAKRLKHEADQETNMGTKCRKYLQAIMKFSECGDRTEQMGDKSVAYNIYNQTLQVNKFLNKLNNSSKKGVRDVDIRLVVLSMRAQSLLNLRLYKMKRHELKDYQRTIQDVLSKSDTDSEPQPSNEQIHSPTPSPAGSEGSNCSKVLKYFSLWSIDFLVTSLLSSSYRVDCRLCI